MPQLSMPVAMLLGAGIGGGTTLAAAKMSSGAAKAGIKSQQQLAQEAAARAKPAYDQAYNYYSGLLKGGDELQRAVAPEVQAINQQFDAARQGAVANAYTRGGGLDKTLRTMEAGRSFSLADLYGRVRPMGAAGLAGLAGADTANSAQLMAGANQAAALQGLQRGQALESLGGIFTRLLTTPGLFNRGQDVPQQPAGRSLPPAVAGPPGYQSVIGTPFGPANDIRYPAGSYDIMAPLGGRVG